MRDGAKNYGLHDISKFVDELSSECHFSDTLERRRLRGDLMFKSLKDLMFKRMKRLDKRGKMKFFSRMLGPGRGHSLRVKKMRVRIDLRQGSFSQS